ncbi:hypothetical protein GJV85_10610 [Sulfurimonas aquatica]|uniref:Uncharacterized protein n=1 Tax=Sulfurimonas aquatica TaxID=2672570 RepID=A0A975B1R3_9BACT|nr:hypothetical protein [Sulfurimonas aquatica]QSZ42538.1 hypothetical protein GJV85_10610 [Sulfurimonas aquatica]
MLENVIYEKDFAEIMKKSIQDVIIHFFSIEQNFGILCKIEEVDFTPELPEDINSDFRPLTLFFLAGYTFETARIEDGLLIFEAGFGADNYGSIVTVPLISIMQIIIDETPVLINLSVYKEEVQKEVVEGDEPGVKNSMESFLNNPENSKFIKK